MFVENTWNMAYTAIQLMSNCACRSSFCFCHFHKCGAIEYSTFFLAIIWKLFSFLHNFSFRAFTTSFQVNLTFCPAHGWSIVSFLLFNIDILDRNGKCAMSLCLYDPYQTHKHITKNRNGGEKNEKKLTHKYDRKRVCVLLQNFQLLFWILCFLFDFEKKLTGCLILIRTRTK